MLSTQDGDIYIKVNQKGSAGIDGEEWDDGPGGQVKYICICHGDLIYSIQTTYERQGTAVISHRHGGGQGNFEMVSFNEPLTWVSGHYGSYRYDPLSFLDEEEEPENYCKVIYSLKFGTDRSTYGPFGREVGEPFLFKSTTRISGFHGRSSNEILHAIGVYVSTLASHIIGSPLLPIVNNFKSVEGFGNDCKSVEASK